MLRYVLTGEVADVSRAVGLMFEKDLLPAMRDGAARTPLGVGPTDGALQNSNDFRERACYTWETDDVITDHLTSLKSMFDGYAKSSAGEDAALQGLLGLDEWQQLMTDAEMIDDECVVRALAREGRGGEGRGGGA